MSKQSIEGNQLIAIFDGKSRIHPNDLKYHSSWDWIHGAIEKAHDECKLHPAGLRFFDRLTIFSTINQVWERLVQFINWYNQNKQS